MAHRSGDHGYRAGLSFTAGGLAAGAVIAAGHAHAMEHVRRRQQEREEAVHEAEISARLEGAERLKAYAMELASELARTKAENAKLRRCLAQRQAYIDSLRDA